DVQGTLRVEVEQNVAAARRTLLHRRRRRPIQVAADQGPFHELPTLAPALEIRAVHEVIVHALPYSRARRPGGERYGEFDGPVLLQETLAERGLARTGRGRDHEDRPPQSSRRYDEAPVGGGCHAAPLLACLVKRPAPPGGLSSFKVLHLFADLLHIGLDHERLLA